jgi:hypothetical protein
LLCCYTPAWQAASAVPICLFCLRWLLLFCAAVAKHGCQRLLYPTAAHVVRRARIAFYAVPQHGLQLVLLHLFFPPSCLSAALLSSSMVGSSALAAPASVTHA